MATPQKMSREKLEKTLSSGPPRPESRHEGYALINVLPRESYEQEHIPGSTNAPLDELDELGKRYDKSKTIIVYCASTSCDTSPKAAERLTEMGFTDVYDYEAGMKGWKEAGHEVVTGAAAR